MSTDVDTSLDLTVLDDLDFEPPCDVQWHETKGWPEEPATHIARAACQGCGEHMLRLFGPRCLEHLASLRRDGRGIRHSSCGGRYPATAVTLEPLP